MYFYPLDCYEKAMRHPGHHQDKTNINCYVHLCLELANQCPCLTNANRIYFRMINTFLEVICDDLLNYSWRKHSYRVFKQIKPVLFEMMDTQQYQTLSTTFDKLSDYFLQEINSAAPMTFDYDPRPSR
jgi:hypothetical protein